MPTPCNSCVSVNGSKPMHAARRAGRVAALIAAIAVVAGLSVPMRAQSAAVASSAVDPVIERNVEAWVNQGRGVADDWSHHRMVFSKLGTMQEALGNGTYERWLKIANEPRYTMQVVHRARNAAAGANAPSSAAASAKTFVTSIGGGPGLEAPRQGTKLGKDWSMDLDGGTAATLLGTFTTNGVSSGSTVTVDSVTLDASAPMPASAMGTFQTGTGSGNVKITFGSVATTLTAGGSNACSGSGDTYTGTFTSVTTGGNRATREATNLAAAIAACPAAAGVTATSSSGTVTVTALTAGPGGNSIALTSTIVTSTFTWSNGTSSTDLSGGSEGVTSGTSFAYFELTPLQVASNLAAAINQNTTLQTPSTGVSATASLNASGYAVVTVTGRSAGAISYGAGSSTIPAGFTWGAFTAGAATSGMPGAVGAGMYPAKYSFNPTGTPECADAAQPDYVVYNTAVAGAATQASLVAYDNLYVNSSGTGYCTGATAPSVYWAYNTGGTILTSPALWYDGSQIAFVHSTTSGGASLVLLKWAPSATPRALTINATSGSAAFTVTSGTLAATDVGAQVTGLGIPANDTIASVNVGAGTGAFATTAGSGAGSGETLNVLAETPFTPGSPTVVTPANYSACIAPCMTSVSFSDGHPDTRSAPYVDYGTGTVYVGDDAGYLHQFLFAFENPQEASGWPIKVSGNKLTGPVYDSSASPEQVFVADSGGYLYSFNVATGAAVGKSSQIAASTGTGIVDAPIVDSSAGTAYVVVGQDENTDTSYFCQNAVGCNGMFRFTISSFGTTGTGACSSTNGTSWTSGTNCGVEAVFGVGNAADALYDGSFDNTYINGTGTTGNLWNCAANNNDANYPKLMSTSMTSTGFGGTAKVFDATNVINPITNGTASCSPVTEIDNGTDDYIFMSVSANGNQTGCTGACLYNYNVTTSAIGTGIQTAAGSSGLGGSTSGIIIDNTDVGDTGAAQIYYSPLGNLSSCAGTVSATCAVQTSQANP